MSPEGQARAAVAAKAVRRIGVAAMIGTGVSLAASPGWGLVAVGAILLVYDVMAEVRR